MENLFRIHFARYSSGHRDHDTSMSRTTFAAGSCSSTSSVLSKPSRRDATDLRCFRRPANFLRVMTMLYEALHKFRKLLSVDTQATSLLSCDSRSLVSEQLF